MIAIKIMLLSFLIPNQFGVTLGNLVLLPYRIALILLIPYLLWTIATRQSSTRLSICDALAIIAGSWPVIAFSLNSGILAGIESGGVLAFDILVPYTLVRLNVNSYRSRKQFSKLMLGFVAVLFIISLPEAIYGQHFIQEIASKLVEHPYTNTLESRLGIWRAIGPMEHPILLGATCTLVFSIAFTLSLRQKKYIPYVLASVGGAVITVSSGPLLALIVQVGMIIWAKKFRGEANKWLYLLILFVFLYIIVDIISNRDPFRVMFSYLLLNPHNGYVRYQMWIFSFETILQSGWTMLYGFGYDPEVFASIDNRYWRTLLSTTLDSYWLVLMMRFGFPILIIYGLFLILVFKTNLVITRGLKESKERRLLEAWMVAAFSITLVAATVHFWGRVPCIYMMALAACIGHKKIPHKSSNMRQKLNHAS